MTGVVLKLLKDEDMYLFFEEGIRGGISTITNRYAKANNKYMGDQYDPREPITFIPYLDANSLCGWAMCQPLPVGGFEWLTKEEIGTMTRDHSKIKSCTLQVDLEYPKELHDLHSDYLLAPEFVIVNGTSKLIPNPNSKKNYVLHYENLKLLLKNGLKLTKIHRGIEYRESTFLIKYIDSNTDSRKNAKRTFATVQKLTS